MHGISRGLRPHLHGLARCVAPLLAVAAAFGAAAPAASAASPRPLVTGLQDFDYTQTHFERIKESGAGVVKINISWRAVAPTNPPPNFNPASPVEPSYDWEPYDTYVRAAVAAGLEPLITVEQAAAYAERDKSGSPGTGNPDPVQFGLFGEALARRYSGTIPGLPRVRMFEAWNEPNANFFLYPQRTPDGAQRLARPLPRAGQPVRRRRAPGASRQRRRGRRDVPVHDQPRERRSRSGPTASCARCSACPRSSR